MEFNPNNKIIKLCLQGMSLEAGGESEQAATLFIQGWKEAATDHEKFLTSYYIARTQKNITEKITWTETTLQFANKINDASVKSAFPNLYLKLSEYYLQLNDLDKAKKNLELSTLHKNKPTDKGPFYHGTKAKLQMGDLLIPGGGSNYKEGLIMNHIYFTALANGAGLAAALAKGDGEEHVYIIEPTDSYENDPNVTDKKFPGNPTRSYRTTSPLKIIGELTDWIRQSPEEIRQWRERLENNKGEIIN